jgi:O-antigen/teichoic acid export membrane protein
VADAQLIAPMPGAPRLARNALLTFSGFLLPLALALFAIPITAQNLGPVRFGLLGLAWVLLEYLGFVELGLGRTSVRFVAQSLAASPRDVRQTVGVALSTQALLGLAGGIAVAASATWLADSAFDIPLAVRAEAIGMFRVVGANVLVVVLLGALRGVLEGAHRFGTSTAVKIPTAAASVVIPAVGAVAGASLGQIFFWLLLVRMAAVIVLIALLPRVVPGFSWELPREWMRLRALFAYSGWVAVSGVINPLLVSIERFALGAFVGVAALGLYAAPYEGAVRLLLIPTSVFAALFPTLSATFTREDHGGRPGRLAESALRQLSVVLAPVIVVLFALAPEVLQAWLGTFYAPEMSTVFRILLVGVLVNGLAHIPAVYLYAVGRPDLSAKGHIAEVIVYFPLAIGLVRAYGITGAAMAWTIRIMLDAVLLSIFSVRTGALTGWQNVGAWWRLNAAAMTVMVAAAVFAQWMWRSTPLGAAAVLAVGGITFSLLAWRGVLSTDERRAWMRLLSFEPRTS